MQLDKEEKTLNVDATYGLKCLEIFFNCSEKYIIFTDKQIVIKRTIDRYFHTIGLNFQCYEITSLKIHSRIRNDEK